MNIFTPTNYTTKVSKYNFYLEDNSHFYVFNQMTSSLSEIDQELFFILKNNKLADISGQNIIDELYTSGFICDKTLKEEYQILAINKTYRFSHDIARITILPTLDCNFKCWYCYENHHHSMMSSENMNAVIEFCKDIIIQNRIKILHLDWFGGEPLMYFNEIVYPLSLEIMDLCRMNNVKFTHTITTNGYLLNKQMIEKIKEINLTGFQITLDGSEYFHNKTRYTEKDKNSYQTIVQNVTDLCRSINNIDMTVRINYTPKNITTINNIADTFPTDIRKNIFISPQIVWQYKNKINAITDCLKEKLELFSRKGYKSRNIVAPRINCGCYTENMLQFVINYDLSVYKCTARDFSSKKTSIGFIDKKGKFNPNSNYYNYFISSFMENEKCLDCNFLPTCNGMCIQKKIENVKPECPKEEIERSLKNQLLLIINN